MRFSAQALTGHGPLTAHGTYFSWLTTPNGSTANAEVMRLRQGLAVGAAAIAAADPGPGCIAASGTITAPTPSPGDNSTKMATTAFVAAAVAGGGSSVLRSYLAGLTLSTPGSSAAFSVLRCRGRQQQRRDDDARGGDHQDNRRMGGGQRRRRARYRRDSGEHLVPRSSDQATRYQRRRCADLVEPNGPDAAGELHAIPSHRLHEDKPWQPMEFFHPAWR